MAERRDSVDWYEIMNFYAFDIEKADKTAKKLIKWNPVEEALRHGVGNKGSVRFCPNKSSSRMNTTTGASGNFAS